MSQKKETQGWCDGVCGLYDHHLVEGLCPQCRKKFVDFEGEHASDDDYAVRALQQMKYQAEASAQDAWREMFNVEIAA